MNKYDDPTLKDNQPFVMLPVETFNKITWRGGDNALSALLDLDPGAYLGEFRSMVKLEKTKDRDEVILPVLPWTVVTRRSGRETYTRYSATEMLFRPITARNRFVKYAKNDKGQREKNEANGRNKIIAISQKFPGKGSGFDPHKEVFGIVFDDQGIARTRACLVLDAWTSYLSYNEAAMKFNKVKHSETEMPILRIGTRGANDNGITIRKANVFNGFSSVDIEPLDLNKPLMYTIEPMFDELWDAAQGWAGCVRWHSETGVLIDAPAQALPSMPETSRDEPIQEGDGNFPY